MKRRANKQKIIAEYFANQETICNFAPTFKKNIILNNPHKLNLEK